LPPGAIVGGGQIWNFKLFFIKYLGILIQEILPVIMCWKNLLKYKKIHFLNASMEIYNHNFSSAMRPFHLKTKRCKSLINYEGIWRE
jgi:hypothetical protein